MKQSEYIKKVLRHNRRGVENALDETLRLRRQPGKERFSIGASFASPPRAEKKKLQVQRCKKIVFPHVEPLPESTAYIPIRKNFAGSETLSINVFVPYLGDTQRDIESAYRLLTAMDEIRQLQEDHRDDYSNESNPTSQSIWKRGFNLGLRVPRPLHTVLEYGSLSIMDAEDSSKLFRWMQDQQRKLFLIRQTLQMHGNAPEILRALCVCTSIEDADLEPFLQQCQNGVSGRISTPPQTFSDGSEPLERKLSGENDILAVAESDTMRSLFCRRCYCFDCAMHGSQHPLPKAKKILFDPLEFHAEDQSFCSEYCFLHCWSDGLSEMRQAKSRQAFQLKAKQFLKSRENLESDCVPWTPAEIRLLQIGCDLFKADFCRIRQVCLPGRLCVECALYILENEVESLFSPQSKSLTQQSDPQSNSIEIASCNKSADMRVGARLGEHLDLEMSRASEELPESRRLLSFKDEKGIERISLVDTIDEKDEKSGSRSPRKRTRRHIYRPSTIRSYVYQPCNHEGSCVEANCECVSKGRFCEKYCCCCSSIFGGTCAGAFKGCKCRTKCSNKKCPCFAADRECDPDICRSCGACAQPEEGRTCENMNLQLGLQRRLLLGRSDVHGWGIFARTMIPKGSFIGEYCGEVVSQLEAERRGRIHDHTTGVSYLFDLNDEQCIDAHRAGKRTKFINHSRTAPRKNCVVRYRIVKGDIRVGLYADRQIEEGEELFFDYGYESNVNAPLWAHAESRDSNGASKVLTPQTLRRGKGRKARKRQ